MSQSTLHTFLDQIEEALKHSQNVDLSGQKRQGVIHSYKDGVIVIKGLEKLRMGEVVTVKQTGTQALVLNLERDTAHAMVLQFNENLKEGLFVTSTGTVLSLPVSEEVLGRVIDSLGLPLDGAAVLKVAKHYPIEKIAPGVMSRQSVFKPVQTGIVGIDALIPVGRGQRELIIGDRQTGKTTVALDTIINQKDQNMICVYVSIGQRESKLAQVIKTLTRKGAMSYTTVVSAPASSSAVMKFLAPFSGMAVAEYFMDQGKDVLIVFDDLTKHAVAYREMSLLLRRPPGREAYPGDVFYLHSRLLERAAQLNSEHGGGSITALPIIETQAGDVSGYIPTNVISITDGQIFLDANLFYRGVRPAINVGISVSRVGGAAQTKIMKKVAGTAKLMLAQYYELEAFSQFSSELDESTQAQLTRGKRLVEALKQKNGQPYKLWEEIVVILVASGGHLDAIPVENCASKINEVLAHLELTQSETLKSIEKIKEYTPEIEKSLQKGITDFFSKTI